MSTSKIGWTDATWNPITGCTPISEGCAHCYARRMAVRLGGRCGYPPRSADGKTHPFDVTLHPDKLHKPLRWREPRRVFVCSMGDLFHEDVPDYAIDAVFATMAIRGPHTFQVLTKRPARMRDYLLRQVDAGRTWREGVTGQLPPTIWLGVTAENQARAAERIPLLLQTPAAVRFVSVEPMLGPVNLREMAHKDDWHIDALDTPDPACRLDWVICGGETGPGARPMATGWATDLEDQCNAAGVPFFFKQWGSAPAGSRPVAPMRRQFPEVPR